MLALRTGTEIVLAVISLTTRSPTCDLLRACETSDAGHRRLSLRERTFFRGAKDDIPYSPLTTHHSLVLPVRIVRVFQIPKRPAAAHCWHFLEVVRGRRRGRGPFQRP